MSKWCSSCQQEREGKFCMECGKALTEAGSTCACGYHLKPEAKFCPECGKPVAATVNGAASTPDEDRDPLVCPVCNSVQDDENWRFCGVCGEKKEVIVLKQPVIQNHPRYAKLGHGGVDLSDDATQEQGWLMTRDKNTGLIWEIKTEANKDEKYAYDEAKAIFIHKLNEQCFGGFNDWRLPEREELETLREGYYYETELISLKEWIKEESDEEYFKLIKERLKELEEKYYHIDDDCIGGNWFPCMVSGGYWSSPCSYDTDLAWIFPFPHGNTYSCYKASSFYVLAVRTKN